MIESQRHSYHLVVATVLLALVFTGFQGMEYYQAPFTISDSVYGSTFFSATGFHGFLVGEYMKGKKEMLFAAILSICALSSKISPLSTPRGILSQKRFLLSKIPIRGLCSSTNWATHYITMKDVCFFLKTFVKHPAVATHFNYSNSHMASIQRSLLEGRYAFHEYRMLLLESKSDLSPQLWDSTLESYNKTYGIVNHKVDILVAIAVSSLIYKQLHSRNILHATYFNCLGAEKFISEVERWGGGTYLLYLVDVHSALHHVSRDIVKSAINSCVYAEKSVHKLLSSFIDRLPSIESRSLPIFNRKGVGLSLISSLSEVILPLGENIDYYITTLLEQQGVSYRYARYSFTVVIALSKEVDMGKHRDILENIKNYLGVVASRWIEVEWIKPGGPTVSFRRGRISVNDENSVKINVY